MPFGPPIYKYGMLKVHIGSYRGIFVPEKVSINIRGSTYTVMRKYLEFLSAIDRWESMAKACEVMGISYRTGEVWRRRLEELLGGRVIESTKGGRSGGSSSLTPLGEEVLSAYYALASRTKPGFVKSLIGLKMSARNLLRGVVQDVTCDGLICKVTVSLFANQSVTALITSDAAKEQELRKGDEVYVVVKAIDSIVMKE